MADGLALVLVIRMRLYSAVVKQLTRYSQYLCGLFAQPRMQSGLNAKQQKGAG